MNATSRLLLFVVLIAGAGAAGFWIGHRHAADAPTEASTQPADEKATNTVTVGKAEEREIAETIQAYGSVIADPGEVRVLSVEFESRIGRVLVTPGEEVAADTEVMQVDPSPDARVAFQDAKNAFEAAGKDLEQAKQRFADHLATNQDLSQAELALKSAELKLKSLIARGADQTQHLKSPMAGVVSKVDVQEGQIVAAGASLIEIAAQNRIQVKLGVEPGEASALKPGQTVLIRRVEASSDAEIEGTIRIVGKRVDPASRLVDVVVVPPADTKLMLDSFVVGRIVRGTSKGLSVPREALVSDEGGGFAVFTIKDGKAIKHDVHLGAQDNQFALIESDDIHTGDTVALAGSLELDDGMAVVVNDSTTQPTSEPSEPASAPAAGEKPKPEASQ